MSGQAIVTKAGAERYMRPELEGQTVTYESVHTLGTCVQNVRWHGELVAHTLSFKGEDRSVTLIEA